MTTVNPQLIGELPDDSVPAKDEAALASAEDPLLPAIRILPIRGWQSLGLAEIWQYRELLYFLTWRDVKVRYKQTFLGAAWAILQPAMMMIVFTLFFRRMAGVQSGGIPYPVFAYMGLLPWTFFATAIANAGNSVVGSERLITKIYFPRLAVPLAAVAAAVVDLIIAFSLLLVLMLWYHVRPGPQFLLLPLVVAATLLVAIGVGTILASLNVKYRDFRYVIPFMVQVWLFATPSVYMQTSGLGGTGPLRVLLNLNPMTGLVASFRAACSGTAIPWAQFGISYAFAIVAFFAGCLYFRRTERNFADII